jgi:hypothetical protein
VTATKGSTTKNAQKSKKRLKRFTPQNILKKEKRQKTRDCTIYM